MKVFIKRSSRSPIGSEIDIDLISKVEWSDRTGGAHEKERYISLFGKVDYSIGKDLVKCSGRHDRGDNEIKVYICPAKKGSEYYEGYCELRKKAGPRPPREAKPYKMPCTKRILKEIEKGFITRGELRKKLCAEGYKVMTIRNAINTMIRDNRIIVEGSPNSSKQKIIRNSPKG